LGARINEMQTAIYELSRENEEETESRETDAEGGLISKRGRSRAKHSDPNYIMIGGFVHRTVYDAVKRKLAAR